MFKRIKRLVLSIYETERALNVLNSKVEELESKIDDIRDNTISEKELCEQNEIINQCTDRIIEYVHSKDWEQNKYLYGRLQDIAGYQTAQFIIDNMNKVPNLIDSLEILDKDIEEVSVDGLYLEFGVFQGRTINRIANQVKNTVYGFDSFEGLPEVWRSGFEKGVFKIDGLPEVAENVQLVKGWFNETLPDFLKKHTEKCAFIHIDCDLYSSTKYVLNALKDRIVDGTIISFDEYFNYPGWQEGEYKAFKEFVEENDIEFEYLYYVDTFEQVSVKITKI